MGKKKTQTWLNRGLFLGGYLALVTSQAEFAKALADIKMTDYTDDFVPNGWPACTHSFENVDGSIACIVGLNLERCAEQDSIDVAALLVHEAVHVWQQNESKAGKLGCFGDEGEAYAIQNISTSLMTEYVRRING
jgi:hypothetical protein